MAATQAEPTKEATPTKTLPVAIQLQAGTQLLVAIPTSTQAEPTQEDSPRTLAVAIQALEATLTSIQAGGAMPTSTQVATLFEGGIQVKALVSLEDILGAILVEEEGTPTGTPTTRSSAPATEEGGMGKGATAWEALLSPAPFRAWDTPPLSVPRALPRRP